MTVRIMEGGRSWPWHGTYAAALAFAGRRTALGMDTRAVLA